MVLQPSKTLLLLILILSVLAVDNPKQTPKFDHLSLSQKQLIFKTKHYVDLLEKLQDEGLLSEKMAQQKISQYIAELNKEIVTDGSFDKLQETDEFFKLLMTAAQSKGSLAGKVSGFFTFINIIWFIATLIIILAIGGLFALYIIPFLMHLPTVLLELLVWAACFGLIVAGKYFSPSVGSFIALPGCLGLVGAYTFTLKVHAKGGGDVKLALKIASILCSVVWGITAIWYDSSMIGFMTVGALESLLGFVAMSVPFCYMIGFQSDAAMVRAMGASVILLIVYIIITLGNFKFFWFRPFETGIHFLGTFVYFLGLLIVSNRYYHGNYFNLRAYLLSNIAALGSGIIALFLGSVFEGLGYLQGVGGTFFMLMLLDKYSEIPWKNTFATWGLLGLGGILYGMSFFIRTHPQYFIFKI